MSDMKELENWTPEPFEERPDSELNPFLDMIIRAANDPEIQKDFQEWLKDPKNQKNRPSKHRHLYLESDLDKGLGE